MDGIPFASSDNCIGVGCVPPHPLPSPLPAASLAFLSQDVQYKIYEVARKRFGHGGTSRIQYTLVPLTFSVMRLTREIHDLRDAPEGKKPKTNIKKLFRFQHEVITALGSHYSEMAFKLFLSSARLADALGFEPIAYECVHTRCFRLARNRPAQLHGVHRSLCLLALFCRPPPRPRCTSCCFVLAQTLTNAPVPRCSLAPLSFPPYTHPNLSNFD